MTKCLAVFTIVSLLTGTIAVAQESNTELARKAAESWLAEVDNGDYASSYDAAASYFRHAVTKQEWLQKADAVRGPLGKVISRKLKSAQYETSLPGAPDGAYVVMQYDTSFEHKRSAVETITPMRDEDSQWRVSGYFIR